MQVLNRDRPNENKKMIDGQSTGASIMLNFDWCEMSES